MKIWWKWQFQISRFLKTAIVRYFVSISIKMSIFSRSKKIRLCRLNQPPNFSGFLLFCYFFENKSIFPNFCLNFCGNRFFPIYSQSVDIFTGASKIRSKTHSPPEKEPTYYLFNSSWSTQKHSQKTTWKFVLKNWPGLEKSWFEIFEIQSIFERVTRWSNVRLMDFLFISRFAKLDFSIRKTRLGCFIHRLLGNKSFLQKKLLYKTLKHFFCLVLIFWNKSCHLITNCQLH